MDVTGCPGCVGAGFQFFQPAGTNQQGVTKHLYVPRTSKSWARAIDKADVTLLSD